MGIKMKRLAIGVLLFLTLFTGDVYAQDPYEQSKSCWETCWETETVVMTRRYAKKRRPGGSYFYKRGYFVRY
jgi:hypothetical protein